MYHIVAEGDNIFEDGKLDFLGAEIDKHANRYPFKKDRLGQFSLYDVWVLPDYANIFVEYAMHKLPNGEIDIDLLLCVLFDEMPDFVNERVENLNRALSDIKAMKN